MNRRNVSVFLLVSGMTFILGTSVSFASGWQITQLTDNDYNDLTPNLSDGSLVWCANIVDSSTSGREIMLYNGGVTTRLTTNNYEDLAPRVTAGGICWQGRVDGGDWEIFYRSAGETHQLTNNNFNDYSPKVCNSQVVWHSQTSDGNEIFLYDGSTTTRLTNNTYSDVYPVISPSRVAWSGQSDGDWEIFCYDGANTTPLTSNAVDDTAVCFGDNVMFWCTQDDSGAITNNRIAMYDGTETTILSDGVFDAQNPTACGDRVVWRSPDPEQGNHDIFLYTGMEVLRLTNGQYTYEPVISEQLVVWSEFDGNDREIFVYDGESVFQLTDNDYDDKFPCLDGRNIAWVGFCGEEGNQDGEIFLAVHTPEPSTALLLLFGVGWLTKSRRARTIRRSYDKYHCRHG